MAAQARSYCPRLMRGLFFVALLSVTAIQAAPYRPTSDAEILTRLPQRSAAPRPQQGHALSEEQAARLARIFIERARSNGDPRELGYAQGVLAPWWQAEEPPDAIRLLRATLKQSRHDFNGALVDLQQLLERRPDDAQAWLTQATVLRVLGRYQEAADACAALQGRAAAFVAALCSAAVHGLSGGLQTAAAQLDELRPQLAAQSAGVAAWYYAERVEMAERSGNQALTAELYKAALAAYPGDQGLLASYADWLLDRGRAAEVLQLISADEPADALLLRRALALHAVDDPQFDLLNTRVLDTFAAGHRRGEALHLREEARYRLALGDDAEALKLATANWAIQHEPWDARLLLRAAQAAGQPAVAEVVRQWQAATGFEDVRLAESAR